MIHPVPTFPKRVSRGALGTDLSRVSRLVPRTAHQIKVCLYALAASGLLLWDGFSLPWSLTATALVAHVLGSVVLAGLCVLPFWIRHRRRLRISRRPEMRLTGRIIETALTLLLLSGVYLFLVGNTGNLAGAVAHQMHLWGTALILLLMIVHRNRGVLARVARPVSGRSHRARRSRSSL